MWSRSKVKLMPSWFGILLGLDTSSYYLTFGFFNPELLSKHVKDILIHQIEILLGMICHVTQTKNKQNNESTQYLTSC